MRISSNQILSTGIQSIQKHTKDVLEAQRQISSGARYHLASDSALAAGIGVKLDFDKSQFEMFKVNTDFAKTSLSVAETQIRSITLAVDRFRTLMVQAGSSTIGEAGRKAVVEEMKLLKDTIHKFASAVDANGQFILPQVDSSALTKVYVAPSVDLFTSIRYEEVMGKISPGSTQGTGEFIDTEGVLDGIINTIGGANGGSAPDTSQIQDMTNIANQVNNAQVKIGAIINQLDLAEESTLLQKTNNEEANLRQLHSKIDSFEFIKWDQLSGEALVRAHAPLIGDINNIKRLALDIYDYFHGGESSERVTYRINELINESEKLHAAIKTSEQSLHLFIEASLRCESIQSDQVAEWNNRIKEIYCSLIKQKSKIYDYFKYLNTNNHE